MGFLDRLLGGGDDDDPQRQADIARVTAGGIPLAAEQRIRELAGGGTAFTSGLSVADFALAQLDRVRPICQVMGSSVYKVGWQNYPWGSVYADNIQLRKLDVDRDVPVHGVVMSWKEVAQSIETKSRSTEQLCKGAEGPLLPQCEVIR